MKSSKVFVLPSSREGFGITVLEANACGIPIVTVDEKNNAAQSLITNGKNGYVCKLDEKEIAKNIVKGFKLTEKDDSLTKKEIKNKYSWNIISKKIVEEYLK
jgi:glycosyltransferase involved in cell wall biosynthesis